MAQSGLTNWDFGDWPAIVEIQQQASFSVGDNNKGQLVYAYPALVDYEDSVSIELFETQSDAEFYHATGIARLIFLQLSQTIKYLRKNFPKIDESALMYCAIATKAELIEDMILASIFDCFLSGELPASNQSFADCLKKNEHQFIDHANKLAEVTHRALSHYRAAISAIDDSKLPVAHRADMLEQCGNLVYDGFLRDMSMPNLSRMSAYFQAIQKRIANFKPGSTQIDNLHTLIRKFWDQYLELCERDEIDTAKLEQFRWMIEEFRIACFAQPMKTKRPVSEKRLNTLLTSIGP